jgi:hypothetical protein
MFLMEDFAEEMIDFSKESEMILYPWPIEIKEETGMVILPLMIEWFVDCFKPIFFLKKLKLEINF